MPTIDLKSRVDLIASAIRARHKLAADTPVGVKVLPAEVTMDDVDAHKFTARITKNIADRDDEAVLPSGGIFTEFDKSGAIFWNHSYDQPVAIPGPLSKTNDEVVGKAAFLKRPDDYQGEFLPDFARAFVSQMKAAGKAVGVSIGFIPLENRKPTAKDRQEYGDRIRNVVTRWKLLEWSIAPVQANPESYVMAVGKSIGPAACKALFGVEVQVVPRIPTDDEMRRLSDHADRKRQARDAVIARAKLARQRVERRTRAQAAAKQAQVMAVDMAESRLRGGLWV